MLSITETRTAKAVLQIAKTYLIVIFPIVLVLLAARLVMTPLFLQFEYNRADFPADPFGFTREDRLTYRALCAELFTQRCRRGISWRSEICRWSHSSMQQTNCDTCAT